jgi:hypothetical protein
MVTSPASLPCELTSLAGRPQSAPQQGRLRDRLLTWTQETGDDLTNRCDSLPEAGTIMASGRPGP